MLAPPDSPAACSVNWRKLSRTIAISASSSARAALQSMIVIFRLRLPRHSFFQRNRNYRTTIAASKWVITAQTQQRQIRRSPNLGPARFEPVLHLVEGVHGGRQVIEITKTTNGYIATATPPHVNEIWKTQNAVSAKTIIAELKARGAHQSDIGDALYAADPRWLEGSN